MTKRVKFTLLSLVLLAGLAWPRSPFAEDKAHKYMGVANCKMCHSKKDEGEQFKQWQETKHAKAFETLGTDQAKELAKKQGIDDPQTSPKCLKCHVTGHGEPADRFDKKFDPKQGVQCESCHGAGGDYWKKETMKDKQKSIANGLRIPDEKFCRTCHNPESPSYVEFKFDEFWKKVQHPKPKK